MKRIRMEGEGKGGGKGVCVGKCSWMMDAYTDVDGLAHKKTEKRTVMQTDRQADKQSLIVSLCREVHNIETRIFKDESIRWQQNRS